MSKTELRFEFLKPFEDAWAEAIQRLHGVYGFHAIRLAPDLAGLTVVYDASRLTPDDVEHELRMAGLPVRRAAAHAVHPS
ncbi:MAG: hypothetical protein N2036_05465 [Bryobacteraceae bacterium]|nr:hypothetical protein [Bryobacteraceae bacterium]MCX7603508.1 hypothetical protein [Bryobacteraceae bacterium]